MLDKIKLFAHYSRNGDFIFALYETRNYLAKKTTNMWNKWITSKARHKKHTWKWGDAAPAPYQLVMVDPKKIKYNTKPSFRNKLSKYGTYIIGGDWDKPKLSNKSNKHQPTKNERHLVKYECDNDIYHSLRERFVENKSWWDTPIGKRFDRGEYYKSNIQDPEEQFDKIESLYYSIKKDGFKTQAELKKPLSRCSIPEYHDICINICRDGTLAFESNGHHRLSIAKLLELDEIPVRVLVRHKKWQKVRQTYYDTGDLGEYNLEKEIKNHPDLKSY